MADCMKWEPIEECPLRTDVIFLFEGDYGEGNKNVGALTATGRVAENSWGIKRRYHIGFEMAGVTVDFKVEDAPIAFARITLPDFLSDGDE